MKDLNKNDEVGVLIKSMNLLVCLAEAPLTVVELSDRTGISKPTIYRILHTLDSGGFVVRDQDNRKYILGPALIGLGRATRNSADLIRYARPTLTELSKKYNETVNLGVLSYGKVIYLSTLESRQQLRVTVPMTIENNAHTTALGKAILSSMEEEPALKLYLPCMQLKPIKQVDIPNRNSLNIFDHVKRKVLQLIMKMTQ